MNENFSPVWENIGWGRLGIERIKAITTMDGKKYAVGQDGVVRFEAEPGSRWVGDSTFDVAVRMADGARVFILSRFIGAFEVCE